MPIVRHRLVAHHAIGFVHAGRIHVPALKLDLVRVTKKALPDALRTAVQSPSSPVHDVEGPNFERQNIGYIEYIDIQSQRPVGIELVDTTNQDRSEVSPDAPVSSLVGIGQRGATHCLAQSHRVELGGVGTQGGLDVAQGFALGQLRVGHDVKVLGAGQRRDPGVPRVTGYDACETGPRHKLHQLREKRLAKIHGQSPKKSIWGNYSQNSHRHSNLHQIKSAANPRGYWLYLKTGLRPPDTTDSE